VLDNRFDPLEIAVPVGTTVSWSNTGLNHHTATAFDGAFDTGDIAPGASAQLTTFATPGTYRYYCRQHLLSGMLGVIRVQ
jgi:plastocyanin